MYNCVVNRAYNQNLSKLPHKHRTEDFMQYIHLFLSRQVCRGIPADPDIFSFFAVSFKTFYGRTRTQEELHIARTTCLYRVKRIEEIGGFSLNDPDTALYLKKMTRVME